MKKATLVVWVIILGFIALVIFQNQNFFMAHHALRINLGVVDGNLPPELPIAVVFLFFFFSGLVIAYFFSISSRFKARRTIKKLNATVAAHEGEVAELKRELDTLKGLETTAQAPTADTKSESDKVIELTGDSLVKNPAESPGKSSVDKQEKNSASESEDKTGNQKA